MADGEIVHVSSRNLMPGTMEAAMNMAELMATAKLVPTHLRQSPGDCLLVINQAYRWGLDPMTVAQATSVVQGKLCYEGKLVAAVLVSTGAIKGRPDYTFSGEGENRTITISAATNDGKIRTITGTVKDWKSNNQFWKSMPDDMLIYRGIRQWARRYAPEAMLGIYTPDEMINDPEPKKSTDVPPPAGRKVEIEIETPRGNVVAKEPFPPEVVLDAEEVGGPVISDDYLGCEDAIELAASIQELEAVKETMRATWGANVPKGLKDAWTDRKKALRAV